MTIPAAAPTPSARARTSRRCARCAIGCARRTRRRCARALDGHVGRLRGCDRGGSHDHPRRHGDLRRARERSADDEHRATGSRRDRIPGSRRHGRGARRRPARARACRPRSCALADPDARAPQARRAGARHRASADNADASRRSDAGGARGEARSVVPARSRALARRVAPRAPALDLDRRRRHARASSRRAAARARASCARCRTRPRSCAAAPPRSAATPRASADDLALRARALRERRHAAGRRPPRRCSTR